MVNAPFPYSHSQEVYHKVGDFLSNILTPRCFFCILNLPEGTMDNIFPEG